MDEPYVSFCKTSNGSLASMWLKRTLPADSCKQRRAGNVQPESGKGFIRGRGSRAETHTGAVPSAPQTQQCGARKMEKGKAAAGRQRKDTMEREGATVTSSPGEARHLQFSLSS
ncbi:hypothetical protein BS78_02G049500 [Paspalum vaginatum]|nr:hypothetical protein BS78_02G049500 [Paspalum vaginatum]